MQFKSGEKVKAFVQLGVQTQKQWVDDHQTALCPR